MILLAPLLSLVGCLGDGQPTGPRPNVVFVLVDALRRDHLGSFGYGRPTSPRLDALMEEGLLFEDMTSVASQTVPATAALFTGLYPSQSGVQYFGKLHSFDGTHHWQDAGPRLEESHFLMAEWLGTLGYRTTAAVSNPWLQRQFGFAQGFDEYFYDDCANLDAPKQDVCDGNDLVNRAIEWLSANNASSTGQPFFLYLHFMDVHSPYSKPGITTEKFVRPGRVASSNRSAHRQEKRDVDYLSALYDEGIQYVDGVIGRFWDHLVDTGVAEKTLLVVTSDHGDEFQEHGGLGHGTTLYEELVGSFLLLRYPERLPSARISTPISMVDLMPTLAEVLEAPLPYQGLGRSALGLTMSAGRTLPRPSRFLFSELGELKAIRQGEWKLILEVESGGMELFDLANDPRERVNLAASEPEKAQELRDGLLASLARSATERPAESTQVPIDEDTLERLRALGYMQ